MLVVEELIVEVLVEVEGLGIEVVVVLRVVLGPSRVGSFA